MSGYHHGNLRNSLIDEAIRQLQSRPDSEISLRKLAIAIGVSNNAPYRHFRDKQTLLDNIAEEGFKRLYHQIDLACSPLSTVGRGLRVAGESYLDFARKQPSLYKLMYASIGDGNVPTLREAREAIVQLFAEIIRGESARPDDGSSLYTANCVLSYLHGVASMELNNFLQVESNDSWDFLSPLSRVMSLIPAAG